MNTNSTVELRDIKALVSKWKDGDSEAEKILLGLIKVKSNFNFLRELVIHGFEPAFNLPLLNNDGENENVLGSGDFFNNIGYIFYPANQFDVDEIRSRLRERPMYHFEEYYFYRYFDSRKGKIRKSVTPKVLEVNKIADYINKNFEHITAEKFLYLTKRLYLLTYNRKYRT